MDAVIQRLYSFRRYGGHLCRREDIEGRSYWVYQESRCDFALGVSYLAQGEGDAGCLLRAELVNFDKQNWLQ